MTKLNENFLPAQYEETGRHPINHNYLRRQFADHQAIFAAFEELLHNTDFTLGRAVDEFESRICQLTGAAHCVGVGNGTDAIFLSLKAAGIGAGDEVITTPHTFFATVGAIATAGARPVFADIGLDMNLDPARVAEVVSERTKAIVPVHWAGLPCDMDALNEIATRHNLVVVEDACHALCATYKGRNAGRLGTAAAFSMHPLKNLNVWGDGGFVVTDSQEIRDRLMLLRNHGLLNRDTCQMWAYNSRLDTLQAIVANHLLSQLPEITERRQQNAASLRRRLQEIEEVELPLYPEDRTHVYHLFSFKARNRSELLPFLTERGIDAKVHYPVPMHLQPASVEYGYRRGDFPVAEALCDSVVSLPVHQFMQEPDLDTMVDALKEFYARKVR